MAEDPRPPPVAIRITRPYDNEDEFLEHELDTLTRTSVTLLGAQPRPQGVVLRFELVLSSGQPILRGEGRVVGFKPNVLHGLGGLTLRFTRLDSRSKALVDKAAVERERRRPSSMPPPGAASPPSRTSDRAPTSMPPQSMPPNLASSRPPAPSPSPAPVSVSPAPASVSPPPVPVRPRSIPPPLPARALKHAPPKAQAPAPAVRRGPVQAPAGREELLERLRARAKRLDATEVERILSRRKRA